MKMTRSIEFECDWCHATIHMDEAVNEDPLEMGWISVEMYDTIKDEPVTYDFCSRDCVLSHFME